MTNPTFHTETDVCVCGHDHEEHWGLAHTGECRDDDGCDCREYWDAGEVARPLVVKSPPVLVTVHDAQGRRYKVRRADLESDRLMLQTFTKPNVPAKQRDDRGHWVLAPFLRRSNICPHHRSEFVTVVLLGDTVTACRICCPFLFESEA